MIVKQLRIARLLSQEQLAQMAGLNVRTIQRIECGLAASPESLKCIAAALDTNVATLRSESVGNAHRDPEWPLLIKLWFLFNYFSRRPSRKATARTIAAAQASGFAFCLLGWFSEPALAGGLIMLSIAYLYRFLAWQGDHYGIWYDMAESPPQT